MVHLPNLEVYGETQQREKGGVEDLSRPRSGAWDLGDGDLGAQDVVPAVPSFSQVSVTLG